MARRSYENIDVRLQHSGDGYAAQVTGSPVGESGVVGFELPFTDERLARLLDRLEPWRMRTRRVLDSSTEAARELGGGLFDALFHDEIRDVLMGSLSRAEDGLRVRIDVTEAAELAGLPWELLFDQAGRRHLALSERTPVVRHLRVPGAQRPLRVDGPLRILAVLSSPVGLEPLDTDLEWEAIGQELGPLTDAGLIALDRLERPTLGHLHRYLRAHDVHVLHVVGHGDFDPRMQDGVLYFENERGTAQAVSSERLGPHLYDHDPLRLVVLNACHSAATARGDAYSGMAQGLVQQGVPAVVAMQVPITDAAAVCFSRDFYTGLAESQPVDQALTGARKALFNDHGFEWATPVLFLRAADGALFTRVEPATARPEPTPEPEPPPDPEPERAATEPEPPPAPDVAASAESPVPAADRKLRVRTRRPDGTDTTVGWSEAAEALQSLARGGVLVLSTPRRSAETYISVKRAAKYYEVTYQYGGPARRFITRVDRLDDVRTIVHTFLTSPPPDFGLSGLSSWDQVPPAVATARRRSERASVSYRVRSLPEQAGDKVFSWRYAIVLGGVTNTLFMTNKLVTMNGVSSPLHRRDPQTVSVRIRATGEQGEREVSARIRGAGWTTGPVLVLGRTTIPLNHDESGTAEGVEPA